jgi:hypothetical protein
MSGEWQKRTEAERSTSEKSHARGTSKADRLWAVQEYGGKGPEVRETTLISPTNKLAFFRYAHLPDEDKEAILLSRFNKLPNQQKQMYESIAQNYQIWAAIEAPTLTISISIPQNLNNKPSIYQPFAFLKPFIMYLNKSLGLIIYRN